MRLVRLREGQGLVFTTETGARSTPPTSFRQRSFAQLLKRARLGRVRFHDLWQTFATLLLSQNTYPKFVQELLGHAATARLFTCYQVTPSTEDHAARATEDTLP